MNIFHQIKYLRTNSSEPENMRQLLALYWQVLLVSVFVLVVSTFLYGGWQLTSVMDTVAMVQTSPAATSSKSSVNSARVDSVLNGFNMRQNEFEARKKNGPAVADPAQ